jgi:hypothetical protein
MLLLLVSSKVYGWELRNDYLKLRTKKVFYNSRGHKSLGLDEVIWQKKEMEEQQFVTDFI